jgi:hypothetical protein
MLAEVLGDIGSRHLVRDGRKRLVLVEDLWRSCLCPTLDDDRSPVNGAHVEVAQPGRATRLRRRGLDTQQPGLLCHQTFDFSGGAALLKFRSLQLRGDGIALPHRLVPLEERTPDEGYAA